MAELERQRRVDVRVVLRVTALVEERPEVVPSAGAESWSGFPQNRLIWMG